MIKRITEPTAKTNKFPSQKKATSAKGPNWGVSCIEGAENLALFADYDIRQSYYNKKKNYDLANDIIDMKDVEKVCSPLGLEMSSFPATMQNYPLANPKIKLLLGEEMKRKFEYRVRSTNPHTINGREDARKNALVQYATQMIQEDKEFSEEQIKNKLQNINKYHKYSYQDMREKMASDILQFFWKEQDLKMKFSRGMEDALIAGEEIYRIDIVAGQPAVTKCNPLNIFTYGTGESPYVDDADIVIEDSYVSVGKVIDEFYEFLKPTDIQKLEERWNSGTGSRGKGDTLNYKNFFPQLQVSTFTQDPITVDTSENKNRFGGYWDEAGNIRVTRVVWKSRRKVGKLSYTDRFGDTQTTIVDENYKVDSELGETIEWLWVNEYWEGTRIGKDLYVKIQPRPVQFRSTNNLSKCGSGYVGTAYNINASRARSLYDQMKPYQYLYNIFMYRTELAFAKYKGPIMEINAAAIPDEWKIEDWIYYAEVMGYALMDPFNESKKGNSEGTMAGSMNTVGGKILSDNSISSYIESNIQMLNYLEQQIGSISGVSQQRQGQIETRELVGNVDRAVTQSSHITEPWFNTHDHVKLRVLEALLETAKYCFKEETDKRVQYVLDDMSTHVLKIDGAALNECDYTVFINNAAKDMEFEQSLKQLAHAGLQNDKLNFADVIRVFSSNNLTDMSKAIEGAEERKQQEMREAEEAQKKHEQEMAQHQQEAAKQLQEMHIENREDEQASRLEEIRIKGEEDRATLVLQSQIDQGKELDNMWLEEQKIRSQEKLKEKELDIKNKESERTSRLKEKEMNRNAELKRREIESNIRLKRLESEKARKLEEEKTKKNLALQEKLKAEEGKTKKTIATKDGKVKEEIAKEQMALKTKEVTHAMKLKEEESKKELELREKEGEQELVLEREKMKIQLELERAKAAMQKQNASKKDTGSNK